MSPAPENATSRDDGGEEQDTSSPGSMASASSLAEAAMARAEDAAYRRRPRQTRGQQRVTLLLDAAAAVIARSGLQAATAEAIAAEAHTAKGSLYQFFPNRDAVLAALAMRYAEEMRAIYERALPPDAHALPLPVLIDRIIKPLAAFHDHNPAFRRVFAHHDLPHDLAATSPSQLRVQLFESFVERFESVFAARNPGLQARECRRIALITATVGQSVLARRARAVPSEKRPILDELRQLLQLYLSPVLDPESPKRQRGAHTSAKRKGTDPAS